MLAIPIFYKALVTRIYKQFLQLNNKKTNHPTQISKKLEHLFHGRRFLKWFISTEKGFTSVCHLENANIKVTIVYTTKSLK